MFRLFFLAFEKKNIFPFPYEFFYRNSNSVKISGENSSIWLRHSSLFVGSFKKISRSRTSEVSVGGCWLVERKVTWKTCQMCVFFVNNPKCETLTFQIVFALWDSDGKTQLWCFGSFYKEGFIYVYIIYNFRIFRECKPSKWQIHPWSTNPSTHWPCIH